MTAKVIVTYDLHFKHCKNYNQGKKHSYFIYTEEPHTRDICKFENNLEKNEVIQLTEVCVKMWEITPPDM